MKPKPKQKTRAGILKNKHFKAVNMSGIDRIKKMDVWEL